MLLILPVFFCGRRPVEQRKKTTNHLLCEGKADSDKKVSQKKGLCG